MFSPHPSTPSQSAPSVASGPAFATEYKSAAVPAAPVVTYGASFGLPPPPPQVCSYSPCPYNSYSFSAMSCFFWDNMPSLMIACPLTRFLHDYMHANTHTHTSSYSCQVIGPIILKPTAPPAAAAAQDKKRPGTTHNARVYKHTHTHARVHTHMHTHSYAAKPVVRAAAEKKWVDPTLNEWPDSKQWNAVGVCVSVCVCSCVHLRVCGYARCVVSCVCTSFHARYVCLYFRVRLLLHFRESACLCQ